MTSKIKRLSAMLFLAIMVFLSAGTFTQVNASAMDDLTFTVDNGKLTIGGNTFSDNSTSAWNSFLEKYKGFIVGISGVGAVTMIGIFIFNFVKLGTTSTNPGERAKVLQGLVWSAIAAAGLGAVAILVGFFYGMFK